MHNITRSKQQLLKMFNMLFKYIFSKKLVLWFFLTAVIFLGFQLNTLTSSSKSALFEDVLGDIDQGDFRRIIKYKNEEIGSQDYRFLGVLQEKVIKVEQYSQSLYRRIPSGLVTLITWFIGGCSVRHEYTVVHTKDHAMSIDLGQKSGDGYFTISIWPCQTELQRLQVQESHLLKDRWLNIKLSSFDESDIGDLTFCQINKCLGLIVLCWRGLNMFRKGKYDVLFKNCKSFSRSIQLFSLRETPIDSIMQSILGLYTDVYWDSISRLEIQRLLDFVYNQTVSTVSKVNHIMELMKEIRHPTDIF